MLFVFYFVKSDDKRLGEINRRMESCLADLVKEQTGFILVSLDLATIVSIIAQVFTLNATCFFLNLLR